MISSLFGIVMAVAGAIGLLALVWCGVARCSRCGRWHPGKTDCDEE
jgi:putative component of membrane protein insertase Oxa1/YidC/SpoIIIJ protein YidD